MEDTGFASDPVDGQANPMNVECGGPRRQVSLPLRFEAMAVPDTGGMEITQRNPIGARFDETILDPPGRRVGPGMLPGIFENIVPERGGCQRHRLARDDSSGTGECPSVIR